MYCGLKVLLWEAGRPARRPGAGGIGTKTNSAPNCSWVGVGVWAELGNKLILVLPFKTDTERHMPSGDFFLFQ